MPRMWLQMSKACSKSWNSWTKMLSLDNHTDNSFLNFRDKSSLPVLSITCKQEMLIHITIYHVHFTISQTRTNWQIYDRSGQFMYQMKWNSIKTYITYNNQWQNINEINAPFSNRKSITTSATTLQTETLTPQLETSNCILFFLKNVGGTIKHIKILHTNQPLPASIFPCISFLKNK